MQGKIVRINAERGFGFIAHEGDPAGDHFFHFKDLAELPFGPELVGQRVEFDSAMGDKGLRAREVRPVKK